MRKIAIINQKGGVGKTTSCCNIGAAVAATGRSVLLLDLDPQAHLTMHFGVEPTGDQPGIYEVLTENLPVDQATVMVREGIRLIPSHIDLAAAEMELVSVVGRERILAEAIEKYTEPQDFLIIDCPPSLGVLTINALAAVNEVMIPLQPHFLALQGVGKLLESISLIKNRINPDLRVSGIILCMNEPTTRLAGEVAADLQSFLDASRGTDKPWADARVFESTIRRNIKLAECPSHGQTIFEYEQRSNGATDYARLAAEIIGDQTQLTAKAIAKRFANPTTSTRTTDSASSVEAPESVADESAANLDVSDSQVESIQIDDRTVTGPLDVPDEIERVPEESTTATAPTIELDPNASQPKRSESIDTAAGQPSDAGPRKIQVVFEDDSSWHAVGSPTSNRD